MKTRTIFKTTKQFGFTLVELLVVLGIIAVLIAVMFTTYVKSAQNKKIAQEMFKETHNMNVVGTKLNNEKFD